MPSRVPPDGRVTRRRVLAGVGTVLAGGLAGCGGRLPGTGPTRLDAETTVEDGPDPRVLWQYPPRDGDEAGIGYAEVAVDRVIQAEERPSAIHVTFNSTVGAAGSSEQDGGYRPDWFRFRLWPPASYESRINHRVRVEPPGQWEGFSTYYDIQGTVRRTTVELRDVDTRGTIQIPAVFVPGANPLPDRLHCSVTVQASRPGLLGETVRVAERGTLELDG